jgi:MFS family permease
MATVNDIRTSPMLENAALDRAWAVLVGACLCMFCGTPAVVYYTFGVFVPEIIADTGWSATGVHGAIGPGALIVALMAPFVGTLSDRFGAKPLVLVGGPAFGIGIALLGSGPASAGSFTAFIILMFALSFAASPIIYAQMMTGWFDKRRGMAIGLIFAAGAVGIAIWPSYAALLIQRFGWRDAYAVMGGTAGTIIFLSGLLLIKNAPLRTQAVGADGVPGLLTREALRTARFWKIAAVFTLMSAVLGGTAVQLPVILRQTGADAQTAAAILSVVGISMLVGRLLLGFLLDRYFAPYLTILIAIISICSFALLLYSATPVSLIVASALLGFGLGSEYAEVAYIVSRAFGLRAFGAIYGSVTFATGIGLAVGPAVIGIALVSKVSTTLIFGSAIAVLVLAIVVLLTFKRSDLPFGVASAA